MKIKAWIDYNKKEDIYYPNIYFLRPTTKHTNPDVISRKIIISCNGKRRNKIGV